jgi:hypothetical protein
MIETRADPGPANDLANLLFALDGGSLRTAAITRRITTAIVAWALGRGWSVQTEARVNVAEGSVDDDDRLGYLDIVVRRGAGWPDIAIEIDSTDKPWSVTKLRHAAAAGMHAIWIRWGDDDWTGVHRDIDVIQLRISRAPQPRANGAAQLALWPAAPGPPRAGSR